MNKSKTLAVLGLTASILLGGCAQLDLITRVSAAATNSVDPTIELDTQSDLEIMLSNPLFAQATPSFAVEDDNSTLTDQEKIDLAQSLFLAVHLVHSTLAIKKLEIRLEAAVLTRVGAAFKEAELTLSEEDIALMDTYLTDIGTLKNSIGEKATQARTLIRDLRGHVTLANIDVVISTLQDVQDLQVEIRDLVATLLTNVVDAYTLLLNYFTTETAPISEASLATIADIKVVFESLAAIRAELLDTNSDVKTAIRNLRLSLDAFKTAGLTLTSQDRVTLGISRLALRDAYENFQTEMEGIRESLDGLKGNMNLDNLDLIKTTFIDLVSTLTNRKLELGDVLTTVNEAKAIIDSYL